MSMNQSISEELMEELAAIEHDRWSKWQKYLHSKCVEHENGKGEFVCFPSESFLHWERQIATPYSELSEKEKESDREQVRSYLPLLRKELREKVEEMKMQQKYEEDFPKSNTPRSETEEWRRKMYGYNQAIDDVLAILEEK